jgi:DNA-directed RNA polymerase specialized sigma24 family protein
MELSIEGLTPAEIGEVLGKTSEAVRQNLLGARKRLLAGGTAQLKRDAR